MKKLLRILWIIIAIIIAWRVADKILHNLDVQRKANVTLANPASVYCQQQSGTLEIITDTSGAQSGICHLTGWINCEEWAYMRGECPVIRTGTIWTVEITWAVENSWLIDLATYTNTGYKFSFQYPKNLVPYSMDNSDAGNNSVGFKHYTDTAGNRGNTLEVDVKNGSYGSFKDFRTWYESGGTLVVWVDSLKSFKQIKVGNLDAIETAEITSLDTSMTETFVYITKDNLVLKFWWRDPKGSLWDPSSPKDETFLLKILSTLKFIQ